ncbi:MAG: T9SS type A sorting domain-containing protein, partial [Bacteroidota bacterium]
QEIFKTTNAGLNWTSVEIGPQPGSIRKIVINKNNSSSINLLIDDKYCKSNDNGKSLITLIGGKVWDFLIDKHDTLIQYITGPNGGIYKTNDGGQNWVRKMNGIPLWERISFVAIKASIDANNVLYAIDESIGVFRSYDAADSWERVDMAAFQPKAMYFENNTNTLFCGVNEFFLIFATSDFGISWKHEIFSGDQTLRYQTYDLKFDPFDPFLGYLCTSDGVFTTEKNWIEWQKREDLPVFTSVKFHPNIQGLLYAGSPSGSYISTDNGLTWSIIKSTPSMYITTDNLDDAIVYSGEFINNSIKIQRSTDYGNTWKYIGQGVTKNKEGSLTGLYMDQWNNLYASVRSVGTDIGGLYKSSNRGDTWVQIDEAITQIDKWSSVRCMFLDERNSDRFYIGLIEHGDPIVGNYTNGGLYLTENGGLSYRKVYDGAVYNIVSDDSEPRNIFFGTNFGVWHFVDTLNVSSIKSTFASEIVGFSLSQNYPNPFNPSTIIKFQVPSSKFVKLQIHDLLGREVQTLIDAPMLAGKHEVTFNGSGLPSGVYIYTLKVNEFSQSRKMLLLK